MTRRAQIAVIALVSVGFGSCTSPTIRRSGQVELFDVVASGPDKPGGVLKHQQYAFPEQQVTLDQARLGPNGRVDAALGDLVRFTSDTVTMVVPTVYLDHLPVTFGSAFSGRYDALLFAEVWENAAMDRSSKPINRIVYVALDQPVPGMLNFSNAMAYGPTSFKGHPLRVKFTLVLLQRRAKESADSAAKTLQNFVSIVGGGAPAANVSSVVINLIRQVISSLPDVEAFDFEATFLPFHPPETSQNGGFVGSPTLGQRLEALRTMPGAEPERLAEAARVADDIVQRVAAVSMDEAASVTTRHQSIVPWTSGSSPKLTMAPAQVSRSDERTLSELRRAIEAASRAASGDELLTGARELRSAKAGDELSKAIDKIKASSRFAQIAASTTDTAGIEADLNARPWFRYGMHALVETARYRGPDRDPVHFVAKDGAWKDGRFAFGPQAAESLRGTNYLLLDVLPGMAAEDDRVLQAASKAAEDMISAAQYTPSAQLIDNPAKLTNSIEAGRLDMLESLISIRADRLALDLARAAARGLTADDRDKSKLFEPKERFDQEWRLQIEPLLPREAGLVAARWEQLRESIRTRYLARFSP